MSAHTFLCCFVPAVCCVIAATFNIVNDFTPVRHTIHAQMRTRDSVGVAGQLHHFLLMRNPSRHSLFSVLFCLSWFTGRGGGRHRREQVYDMSRTSITTEVVWVVCTLCSHGVPLLTFSLSLSCLCVYNQGPRSPNKKCLHVVVPVEYFVGPFQHILTHSNTLQHTHFVTANTFNWPPLYFCIFF